MNDAEAIRAIREAAWDEGYRAGNVDGYFETREEMNPYRVEATS
jgi:hypothetical protein